MVRFDEVVPLALRVLQEEGIPSAVDVILIRDVAGYLTVVVDDRDLPKEISTKDVAARLARELGEYSLGGERTLLRLVDLIDVQDVVESPDRVRVPERSNTWLVDRLLTNQEWLHSPDHGLTFGFPLAVGFSLKGGVGRSTALGVWAWHLARLGMRVVVLDLDLEAPGIGSLLLDELPSYGMVDWLTETLLSAGPDLEMLEDCLGRSRVAEDAAGLVQVLPAFGARSQDFVAKLGRIYQPVMSGSGQLEGFAARIQRLLFALAARHEAPDVVLIDSRAGLHDIGAAVVTQLGAEVLLFARDEIQSWHAWRLLLRHISRSNAVEFGMPENDLRWKLKMVAAQVEKTEYALADWVESSYEVWTELYDDEAKAGEVTGPAQTFVKAEEAAPHFPLPIYFDSGLRGLSLAEVSRRPTWGAVEAAFEEFLTKATERLFTPEILREGSGHVDGF